MGLPYLSKEKIEKNKTLIQEALSHHSYFVRSGFLVNFLSEQIPRSAEILEVGTGSGELAEELLGRGYRHLTLLDIDEYLPADVQKKVQFIKADLSNAVLPIEDASIDCVLAIAIIEHLENPYHGIRELARVLKPGGTLLVSLPHIHSARSKWNFLFRGELSGYRAENNHIALFTRSLFQKAFAAFTVAEKHFSPGFMKLLGKKIRFPGTFESLNAWFGSDVLYVLVKKHK